jgi:2-dehydro-3-deoxyphosphooctonate aldolase (KDO 8-P synthase)
MKYKQFTEELFFIMGPCVIESMDLLDEVALKVNEFKEKFGISNIVFKASFDKANRTSLNSFRGPGLEKGLVMLSEIKSKYDFTILTDIHEPWQAEPVSQVVDIIQIPAFLCRQTDILVAAAKTNKIVNIKKAQFLSGKDMAFPANKVKESGNSKVLLTERGNVIGYNNLVVDFRNIIDMIAMDYPVVMDCTHSVQRPGGADGKTGGDREYVKYMAKAAKSIGVKGFFFEIHPNPEVALSDGPNMLPFDEIEALLPELIN